MMSADKLLGPEITQGDERERAIFTTGGTVGMVWGFCLCLFTAVVFALFGHLLVPFILVLLAGIPTIITTRYAEKRSVDAFEILARSNAGSSKTWTLGTLAVMLLLSAAMIYTTVTGSGLLEFEVSESWRQSFDSMGNGAAVGAAIGAFGGYLWTVWLIRRRRKQHQRELSLVDDD